MERPQLIRHSTPEAAMSAYLKPAMDETGDDDPRAFSFGGLAADGSEVPPVSLDAVLGGLREQGLWGFTDKPNRTIHFWSSEAASTELRLQFLGHELGHLLEDEPQPNAEDPDLAEELRADLYGDVAALAFALLPELDSEP